MHNAMDENSVPTSEPAVEGDKAGEDSVLEGDGKDGADPVVAKGDDKDGALSVDDNETEYE